MNFDFLCFTKMLQSDRSDRLVVNTAEMAIESDEWWSRLAISLIPGDQQPQIAGPWLACSTNGAV